MSILLADGEQVIRKYRCVTADYGSSDRTLDSVVSIGRKPDTDGVVVVTNRRVIYYAEGKNASKGSDAPPMHLFVGPKQVLGSEGESLLLKNGSLALKSASLALKSHFNRVIYLCHTRACINAFIGRKNVSILHRRDVTR